MLTDARDTNLGMSYMGMFMLGLVLLTGIMIKGTKRRINTRWYMKDKELQEDDTAGIWILAIVGMIVYVVVMWIVFKKYMDIEIFICVIALGIISYVYAGGGVRTILRGYYIKKYHLQDAVVVEIPEKENDKQEESQEESPNGETEHKK